MQGHLSAKSLPVIQIARAIAALLVLVVHAIDLQKFRLDRFGEASGWLSDPQIYSDFGASGVDLFFVISGFVMAMTITRSSQKSCGFLRDRAFRIFPLYWLMTAFLGVELALYARDVPLKAMVTSFTIWPLYRPDEFALPVLFVGWTLAFELAFYVSLMPWLAVSQGCRLLAAGLATGGMGVAGCILAPSADLVALFLNPIWFEFLVGIVLFAAWRRGISRRVGIAAASVGLLVLVLGFLNHVVPDVRHDAIFDGGAGAARALFWALPYGLVLAGTLSLGERLSTKPRLLWRGLVKIGDASFSLYLVHPLILLAVENSVPADVIDPDLLSVLSIVGAILAGLLVHRTIERPLLLFYKRRQHAAVSA
jgi:exopolysaccharide production protein ExoZ